MDERHNRWMQGLTFQCRCNTVVSDPCTLGAHTNDAVELEAEALCVNLEAEARGDTAKATEVPCFSNV